MPIILENNVEILEEEIQQPVIKKRYLKEELSKEIESVKRRINMLKAELDVEQLNLQSLKSKLNLFK